MPRPTTDKKGSTIILRINDETRKYLEENARGETLSSYVRRMILKEKDGKDNVIQNEELPDYVKRIDMYAAPFGITGEELATRLLDGMDSGQIMMEGGGFSAKNEYDFDRFVEACRMKGVATEKMLEKCTQMIKGM